MFKGGFGSSEYWTRAYRTAGRIRREYYSGHFVLNLPLDHWHSCLNSVYYLACLTRVITEDRQRR